MTTIRKKKDHPIQEGLSCCLNWNFPAWSAITGYHLTCKILKPSVPPVPCPDVFYFWRVTYWLEHPAREETSWKLNHCTVETNEKTDFKHTWSRGLTMQNFIKRRVRSKTTKWLQGMLSFRPGWLYTIIMGQTWFSIVCFHWSIFEQIYHNYELYKLNIYMIICI